MATNSLFFFSFYLQFQNEKNKKQKPIPQLIFMLNRSKTNSSFVFVFLPCLFVVDQRSRLIVGHPLVFKLSTTVDRYFVIVIRRHFGFQYRFTSIHFCLYFHVSTLLDFFVLYCSNSHLLFFSTLFGTAILLFMLNASISIPDEGKWYSIFGYKYFIVCTWIFLIFFYFIDAIKVNRMSSLQDVNVVPTTNSTSSSGLVSVVVVCMTVMAVCALVYFAIRCYFDERRWRASALLCKCLPPPSTASLAECGNSCRYVEVSAPLFFSSFYDQ